MHGCDAMNVLSILIVYDDQNFRTYLSSLLHAKGYTVETAENGDQLVRRLSSTRPLPSLILLDVLMPDNDGIELMRKIKDLGLSIPVIIVSGVNHVRTVVEAM